MDRQPTTFDAKTGIFTGSNTLGELISGVVSQFVIREDAKYSRDGRTHRTYTATTRGFNAWNNRHVSRGSKTVSLVGAGVHRIEEGF